MQIEPQWPWICVVSGGFFNKARLKISNRDITAKKGREKECEPTNVGMTLPDVDYHVVPF